MNNVKKVSIIGLGDMGMAMSKNLIARGYDIKGFDNSKVCMDEFSKIGGIKCSSCLEAVKDVDVLIIMVLNGEQLKDVILGDLNIKDSMKKNSTIIISSTVGIDTLKDLEIKLRGTGIRMIDMPVSGSPKDAETGNLTLMVATSNEMVEEYREFLNVIGRDIIHIGEKIGMGQVIKSCLTILTSVTYEAIYDALLIGIKEGISTKVLQKVIGSSVVGNPLVHKTLEHIVINNASDNVRLNAENNDPIDVESLALEIFKASDLFDENKELAMVKVLEAITGC